MRLALRLAVVAVVLAVLGAGLLPPVFARIQLDNDALAAARKGSAAIVGQGATAAEAIAEQAAASHPGIHVDAVWAQGETVYVTLSEDVHTLLHTFHLKSTQGSYLGS